MLLWGMPFCALNQNLIVNGSCEEYYGCPDGPGDIDSCIGWMKYSMNQSPDYLNICSNHEFSSIPSSIGYQLAKEGVGMLHLANTWLSKQEIWKSYRVFIGEPFYQYRESIIGTFTQPLESKNYKFEVYVNHAYFATLDSEFSMAINAFDLKLLKEIETPFTCTLPDNDITSIIDLNPTGVIIDDTASWTKLSVCFMANGGEKYFALGTMRDTTDIFFNHHGFGDYPDFPYLGWYFYDDFSLIQCDTCCGASVPPIEESMTIANSLGGGAKKPKITLNLQANSTAQLELYDAAGRIVLTHGFTTEDKVFEIPAWLAFGMYHARVRSSNGFEDCKKLVLVE
jgi:hypothetical protein